MTKKALLIGINYTGTSGQLNGCINDVNNIKDILSSKYKFDCITVLTDDSLSPSRHNIEVAIKNLVENTKEGDTLVFHYSGHGSSVRDTTGDETDGRDEVLVPLDYKSSGVIKDDWLFENLCKKIPRGATLWCFTDCCHSGTIMDLKYNVKSLCKSIGTVSKKYNSYKNAKH